VGKKNESGEGKSGRLGEEVRGMEDLDIAVGH